MHILYIHQHFATPKGSTGTRSYEFARRWIKAGHKVTVICGHSVRCGLTVVHGPIHQDDIEGINVVVTSVKYSNEQPFFMRIASFLTFVFLSIYAGLRTKNVDVIYTTSTPLTVGITAIVLKWLKHIPYVFEVRDQWPEVPIEMGVIRNRILVKVLLWLERLVYKNSSAIVALSPGQAEGIKKVAPKDKPIIVIPNSCDTNFFKPDIDGSAVRKERGWDDKLVFLHTGAMGKVNNLDFVIDAAVRIKDHSEILFVLLGDGSQKPELQNRIKKLNLKNVEILPSVPKQKLPEILAASDVGLVIIANYPILQHNSANKFFDSLSAGKPVLLNYSGWQREILEKNNAGLGCELCNLKEFVEKALYFSSHRKQLLEMGRNAWRVAVERFDRDKLAMQALEAVTSV